MEREAAFQAAGILIASLPIHRNPNGVWDRPDTDSDESDHLWNAASYGLEEIGHLVEGSISHYFLDWAGDAAIGRGDLARGYDLLPEALPGSRHSSRANNRLNLKLTLGIAIEARDIVSLFQPNLTSFARRHIAAVEQHLNVQIAARALAGSPIAISTWTEDASEHPAGYTLFSGRPNYIATTPPTSWQFYLSDQARQQCSQMIREAENTWREEADLPRVGEGWIAETHLYNSIKSALPDVQVIHHYRSAWLGKQHLDVGIPELRVGVEYQGAQHDQPVAFFGGAEAFARTVERDKRKAAKCRRNGWRLIHVRDGYNLDALLLAITGSQAPAR